MIKKAGTVLINKNQIGLIYRDYYNDYSFPKGHLEEGESLLECAIRETEEETKRKMITLEEEPVYIDHYFDSNHNECECYFYLVRDDGPSDNDSTDTHDLIWVDYDKVEDILTHESLKKQWETIKDKVKGYME